MRIETIGDCTLYQGDCRDILPQVGSVDAVMTDPPYGIDFEYESYEDSRENLTALISSVCPWAVKNAKRSIYLCGITQVSLYPPPDWISAVFWDTTGSFGKLGYTQWMPALFYGTDVAGFGNVEGQVTKSDVFRIKGGAGVGFMRSEKIDHPCPKPINLMKWCVSRFSLSGELVCDPFMGSGSTAIACVKLGRRFIGIEQEAKYFDIACRRIEDAYKQPDLFVSARPPDKADDIAPDLLTTKA